MNEEEIEVTVVKAGTPEGSSQPDEKLATKSSQTWVVVIALLALLGTIGGLGTGYILWQKLTQAQEQSDELSKQLQKRIATQHKQLQTVDQLLAAADDRANKTEEGMTQLKEQVARQAKLDNQALPLMAEVESLLRVAIRRLRFAGDVDTAIMALREADAQLRDSGDPIWIPVREQIAINLATLGGVKRIDLSGLSLRISALSKQVSTIKPLMASVPVVAELKTATDEASDRAFSWDSMLQDTWEALRSLLVIRRHDRPVPVLLPPKQLYFLKQNLQLRLEAAQLALLLRDQVLYADSLERTASWLQEHFDQDQLAVKSMLDEINALRQEEIAPQLPDISGSLRLLLGQTNDSAGQEEPQP